MVKNNGNIIIYTKSSFLFFLVIHCIFFVSFLLIHIFLSFFFIHFCSAYENDIQKKIKNIKYNKIFIRLYFHHIFCVSRFSESCNKLRGKWIVENDLRFMSPANNLISLFLTALSYKICYFLIVNFN